MLGRHEQLRVDGPVLVAASVGGLVDEGSKDALERGIGDAAVGERPQTDAERLVAGVDGQANDVALDAVREQALDGKEQVLHAIDRELATLNLEYAAKRKSLRLNDPELHVMRVGWYDGEKKRLIASGKRLFQAKTVLLAAARPGEKSDTERIVTWA